MRSRPSPDRPRRAFAQYGGTIRRRGDGSTAELLADAWRAASGEGRDLTHGLHPYPARLHPGLARALIARASPAHGVVLDPFCGSGTVAVEALAAGRIGIACDVNAVAVWIARAKTDPLPTARRRDLERAAAAVAAFARGAREADRARIDEGLRDLFDAHVRAEWGALAAGIRRVADAVLRDRLALALSSLLTKLARRSGETGGRVANKRIAPGFATRWFVERVAEWTCADADLDRVARGTPRPAVLRADARRLPVADASVDLVVSSPPYPATYDYAALQQDRARLFGIDVAAAARLEIGARPSSPRAPESRVVDDYAADLGAACREIARVARRGALACLVVGDGFVGSRVVPVAGLVERAAQAAGLAFVASASEDRPISFAPARGAGRRAEHLLAFRR